MKLGKIQLGMTLFACIFAVISYATPPPDTVFKDVLDTPARPSELAKSTLLNGITTAGMRVIAVGQKGHILCSDDRGNNWTQAPVPVSCDLLAVHFPSEKKGWAVGHDGVVLHSEDGGATWVKQFDGRSAAQVMQRYYSNEQQCRLDQVNMAAFSEAELQQYVDDGPDKPFLDVWFENETTGYIVGAFNLIFRTTDGGNSWTPLFDRVENPGRFHLYTIKPIGTDLFITSEQGHVFRRDDSTGQFKDIQTPYTGTFFGSTGVSGAPILFGMRGVVFRSGDGGASWGKIETGILAALTSGTVLADGRIVLVSQMGNILVSSDNGVSFVPVMTDHSVPAAAVTTLDKDALIIAGFRGVSVVSIK
ncbi:MAG: YCF48-related protein [Pseudomonadota bacterium]